MSCSCVTIHSYIHGMKHVYKWAGGTIIVEQRLAKNREICLGNLKHEKPCPYMYSDKDPGSGVALVILESDHDLLDSIGRVIFKKNA